MHVLRDALLVERVDQVGVDQDVRAPRLVLQALDLGDQAPVVREKRRARVEVAVHQRRADEDVAREVRIVRGERRAVRIDRRP